MFCLRELFVTPPLRGRKYSRSLHSVKISLPSKLEKRPLGLDLSSLGFFEPRRIEAQDSNNHTGNNTYSLNCGGK